jgi:hypothetical protein
MTQILDKNQLDVAQIFETFMTSGGDVDKTAAAMNLDRQSIRDLADAEGWNAKIAEWSQLREGDRREVQTRTRRTANYIRARRLLNVIDNLTSSLSEKTPKQLIKLLTKPARPKGKEFSTRPLTDLVKAAETCQTMMQKAVGDTAADGPDKPGSNSLSMALLVSRAMEHADQQDTHPAGAMDKQLNPAAKTH